MKIIKHGNPKYNKPDRKFRCDYCGCIFEAEYGEYKYGNCQYNTWYYEWYYECECPECKRKAYSLL